MGSSGVSGELSFPEYIGRGHRVLLNSSIVEPFVLGETGVPTTNVFKHLTTYMRHDERLNPYQDTVYTDPRADFVIGAADVAKLRTAVEEYDTVPLWKQTLLDARNEVLPILETINMTAQRDNVNVLLPALFSDAQAAAGDAFSELESFDSIFSQSVQMARELMGELDIDIDELIGRSLGLMPELFRELFTVVREMIAAGDLDPIIAAQQARTDLQVAATLRQFHAGMADINAVHSSAFIHGEAIIRTAAMHEMARFAAELAQRFVEQTMNMQHGAYQGHLQTLAQLASQSQQAMQQVVMQTSNFMVSMFTTKHQMKQAVKQMYVETFNQQFRTHVEAALAQTGQQNQAVLQNVGLVLQALQNEVQLHATLAQVQTEMSRVKHVLIGEYESNMLDLDVKYVRWNLDLLEQSANVLAAPGGMAGRLPPGPTKAQSALGGAMMGAGIGMQTGNPLIGLAGGVIGGAAGLLM
jgi:hypothetical protein